MASFNSTNANFSLSSTWKGYEDSDGTNVRYTTSSTGYADKSYGLAGIPAGAIIDSAIVTSTQGAVYTGIDDCLINYDSVDYNFSSGSLDITAKVQASLASGTVSFRYKFKANGDAGTTSVSGISHSASLGFDNNTLTVTYHMPVSTFSLSTSSLDSGQTITVNITPVDASYRHTIDFAFGSASQQYTNVATSQGFTIPLDWLYQIPNSTNATASCTVSTYSGATLMGIAPTQTFTITVPASIKPTLTSLTSALVDGYWGLYVQGYSKVTLTANGATGTYGSTITGYSIAGGSTNPYTTGVLNTPGTNTFTATVTDSRGRVSDAVSCSITVTAYAAPVITSVLVQRASNSGGALADEGTYNKCTLSYTWSAIGSNARTTAIDYKETTASTWTSGSTALITSGSYVVLGSGTTFAIDKSYDIRFTLDDSVSTPVYAYAVLQTAKYIMDFKAGGTGVCFGGVATRDNAVEVSPTWEMYYKSQTLDNRFLRTDTAFSAQWVNGPLYFKSYNGVKTRHIDGSTDAGLAGELFLNYNNPTQPIYLNGTTYYIGSSGAYYNGTAAGLNGVAASGFVGYRGWDTYPGKDANNADNGINFTYAGANNAPLTGPLVTFNPGGYQLQFNATYYAPGDELAFRTRNGDNGTFNAWNQLYHTGNVTRSTASPSGGSDGDIWIKYV